jgi:RNA polymerase sigma-70 factor, ECF subfamily
MLNPYDTRNEDPDRAVRFMEYLEPAQGRIYGYIFAMVPNSNDAHDLYQQTVMVAWQKFEQFEPGTSFIAWAIKVAHFEVLAYRRTSVRSKLRFDDSLVSTLAETSARAMDEDGDGKDRFAQLRKCLSRLSIRDRDLVEMCYRKNQPIHSVATSLGRSSQSVCNSLRRIRMALAECVDRMNSLA